MCRDSLPCCEAGYSIADALLPGDPNPLQVGWRSCCARPQRISANAKSAEEAIIVIMQTHATAMWLERCGETRGDRSTANCRKSLPASKLWKLFASSDLEGQNNLPKQKPTKCRHALHEHTALRPLQGILNSQSQAERDMLTGSNLKFGPTGEVAGTWRGRLSAQCEEGMRWRQLPASPGYCHEDPKRSTGLWPRSRYLCFFLAAHCFWIACSQLVRVLVPTIFARASAN